LIVADERVGTMTRRVLVALMVVAVLAVASVGPATAEVIAVKYLPAPMVQQWLLDMLAGDKLGVDKDSVKRIGIQRTGADLRDQGIIVEGEPAAVEAIKAAIAAADVPRPQLEISTRILEVADATALLGTAVPQRTITLPNGETVPAPGTTTSARPGYGTGGVIRSDWLSGMHLVMNTSQGASLAQFGDDSGFGGGSMGGGFTQGSSGTTIVVNPLVDEAVVTQFIDSGQATVISQPRVTTFEGLSASIGFRFVEPAEGRPREYNNTYRFSAARGEDSLVTVKLLFSWGKPRGESGYIGPLQYTARLGQTVAVAALQADDDMDRVFLITVTAVE
jgi:hypothetical protein